MFGAEKVLHGAEPFALREIISRNPYYHEHCTENERDSFYFSCGVQAALLILVSVVEGFVDG
jgi:hypothetical protein